MDKGARCYESDRVANEPLGVEAVGQLVQMHRLVFERPPQPFDEDIVHAPGPAIHRDGDLGVFVGVRELGWFTGSPDRY